MEDSSFYSLAALMTGLLGAMAGISSLPLGEVGESAQWGVVALGVSTYPRRFHSRYCGFASYHVISGLSGLARKKVIIRLVWVAFLCYAKWEKNRFDVRLFCFDVTSNKKSSDTQSIVN